MLLQKEQGEGRSWEKAINFGFLKARRARPPPRPQTTSYGDTQVQPKQIKPVCTPLPLDGAAPPTRSHLAFRRESPVTSEAAGQVPTGGFPPASQ